MGHDIQHHICNMYCSATGFSSVLVYCSMFCSFYHKARKQLVDKVTYAHDTLWDMTYNITFVTMLVCSLYFYTLVVCTVVIITRLANNSMITFVTCIVAMSVLYFYLHTFVTS
jgi:hypothetical protein